VGGSRAKTLAPHAAVGLGVPRSRAPPRLALMVLRRASARRILPTQTTWTRNFDFGVILHLFPSRRKRRCWLIPTPLLTSELQPSLKKIFVLLFEGNGKTNVLLGTFPHGIYVFGPCTTKVRQIRGEVRHLSYSRFLAQRECFRPGVLDQRTPLSDGVLHQRTPALRAARGVHSGHSQPLFWE